MQGDGNITTGAILAAGRGSRTFPLSDTYPKALLPVCNIPVMQYQMKAMRDAGISEILVVVGHLGKEIQKTFGNGRRFGLRIRYVLDPDPRGIATSLLKVEDETRNPFFCFLGDIFIPPRFLVKMLRKMGKDGMANRVLVKREADPEVIKRHAEIINDGRGKIVELIEKPVAPKSGLRSVGVYLFTSRVFTAIRKTQPSALRGERELTDSIQTLIDLGERIEMTYLDSWDVNISYPEDLIECNVRMLAELGKERIVGRGAKIAPGSVIAKTVVGERATVERPVRLYECVIFHDAKVNYESSEASRMLFAGAHNIPAEGV